MPEFDHGVNVPLLRKTLEYVTEHPEEHDQGSWAERTIRDGVVCRSSHCLAGWAVVLDGEETIDWDHPDDTWEISAQTTKQSVHRIGGRDIEEVAHELLGLPGKVSEKTEVPLFKPDNSLAKLWHLANEVTDGEIEIPDEFR